MAYQDRTGKHLLHRQENIEFNLAQQAIDYFKLTEEMFEGLEVTKPILSLTPDDKLSVLKHLMWEAETGKFSEDSPIDPMENDTVVFNLQVGKGKSTTFYQLMEAYANMDEEEGGYVVIVCSPFIKLVEKDYNLLSEYCPTLKIASYKDLVDENENPIEDISKVLEAKVHIMTIKCLLNNPGDDYPLPASYKKKYLSELRRKATEEGKQVVIFIDELHESINSLTNEYIPYLLLWKSILHKIFIASATYNESSVEVIRLITGALFNKLTIIESIREKTSSQANIYLHIYSEHLHSKNLVPIYYLQNIIESRAERKVNILTGYKSIAEALLDKKNSDEKLVEIVRELAPTLVTGDTGEEFDINGNNIGTTLKTGVDLPDDSIYVIVFPFFKNEHTRVSGSYGIFSDGIPSIIQSIGRMRGKGDIHLFIPEPGAYLNNSFNYPPFISSKKEKYYYPQNAALQLMNETYLGRRKGIEQTISILENRFANEYRYPTLSEYIHNTGQDLLVKHNESFGKGLSPYIIWACIHNQFTNATLQSITYHNRDSELIDLGTKDMLLDSLKELIPGNKISKENLTDAFKSALTYLRNTYQLTDNYYSFKVGSTEYRPETLFKLPSFIQNLVTYASTLIGGTLITSKDKYLRYCMQQVSTSVKFSNKYLYKQLLELVKEFVEFIKANDVVNAQGEPLIHQDLYNSLPDSLVIKGISIISDLRLKEYPLSKAGYHFGQRLPDVSPTNAQELQQAKRILYNELATIALAKGKRRTYKENKQYYQYTILNI
jgi:hypothetical protein